jgi:hypothetical protein
MSLFSLSLSFSLSSSLTLTHILSYSLLIAIKHENLLNTFKENDSVAFNYPESHEECGIPFIRARLDKGGL